MTIDPKLYSMARNHILRWHARAHQCPTKDPYTKEIKKKTINHVHSNAMSDAVQRIKRRRTGLTRSIDWNVNSVFFVFFFKKMLNQ